MFLGGGLSDGAWQRDTSRADFSTRGGISVLDRLCVHLFSLSEVLESSDTKRCDFIVSMQTKYGCLATGTEVIVTDKKNKKTTGENVPVWTKRKVQKYF